MNLLPWNNPLVGTAFMLRARRGNLLINVTLYVIVLVMGYVGWQYYLSLNPQISGNPNNLFLRILFGVQCFLSGIVMLGQAGSSLKNEVMNKTLDFQRIASTGPWEILLGKLFGMPVMAYLLALSAIPVAVFALANGAVGITIFDLLLTWLQLLTFLFLLGSCAIQNTLQITTAKGTGAAPGFGMFMAAVGLMIYATFAAGDSVTYLMDPRRMTMGALFSPLTAYAGIAAENPWAAKFYWFDFQIPCLLFTPVAHIVIAWFFLSIMARRLANVDSTPLGKWKSYLFLFLADAIVAGVLHSCRANGGVLGAAGMSLQVRVGLFLLIHTALSVIYFVTLTPRSDLIISWIWRFRTQSFLRDSLVEDRAPNTIPVLVNLLLAGLGVTLLCMVTSDTFSQPSFLLDAGLTAGMTILTFGLLYQLFQLISRKYAGLYMIMFFFLFGIIPVFVGTALRQPRLTEFNTLGKALLISTPFSQPLRWINDDLDKVFADISPYPVVLAYGLLSSLAFFLTWRWLTVRIMRVERTKFILLEKEKDRTDVVASLSSGTTVV
ncbi:MAG: hypothetical protein QM703_03165 [Gemmatales bacterium]